MVVLLRWAIIALAAFTIIVIGGVVSILFDEIDETFIYTISFCLTLIGLIMLVIAVFDWSTPLYATMSKVNRTLAIATGSGLVLGGLMAASAIATTDYLVGNGVEALEEQKQALGHAALEQALRACGREAPDSFLRRKFRVVDLHMQSGSCPIEGVPAYQARVQSYTIFMIPTDTVFVQCGSVNCSSPSFSEPE